MRFLEGVLIVGCCGCRQIPRLRYVPLGMTALLDRGWVCGGFAASRKTCCYLRRSVPLRRTEGINQSRHKTMQILKNFILSSFVLIQKKKKIKAYTSRRPANGSTANGINVSLRFDGIPF
jgi:hypothetical protein